jgi:PAS domain S-box-containing protein
MKKKDERTDRTGSASRRPQGEADATRLLEELQVHQLELEMQNHQLRLTQEDLETAKERYANLYEFAPSGYFTLDRQGRITEVNLAGAALLGLPRAQLAGRRLGDFVVAASGDFYARFLDRAWVNLGGDFAEEVTLRSAGGGQRFVRIDIGKTARGGELLVIVVDITALRQTLLEQRELKDRLNKIIMSVPGFVVSWKQDLDGTVSLPYASPAIEETLGLKPEDVAQDATPFFARVHADDQRRVADRMAEAARRIVPWHDRYRYVHPLKGERWIEGWAQPQHEADGSFVWYGYAQDVTLEAHAEKQFRVTQQMRELSAHKEKLLEDERKHIAREVHDELGQLLTALKMDISLLRMNRGADPELLAKTDQMRTLVDQTIDVVRHVASNLRPAALDMGLVPAIEWLAEDFSLRWEIPCRVRLQTTDVELTGSRATAVFRLVQESMTNIARHARASEVSISAVQEDAVLQVLVEDNGVGFDPKVVRERRGFGLYGMRERALALGGSVRFESAPGAGTKVRIEIPLDK